MSVFFDEAIKYDQAAHVFYFGTKPACLTVIPLKYQHKKFKDKISLLGWKIFKKRELLFPHSRYIFNESLFEKDKNFKVLHIYVLNKKTLSNCLEENKTFFKGILGSSFSSENFLDKLESGTPLPDLIKNNEILKGIILGYGVESSIAFDKKISDTPKDTVPSLTDTYCCIDLTSPEGCRIHPVVFMGNPNSKEVKQLKLTYEKELEETWEIYKNSKNTLKTTLERLCND